MESQGTRYLYVYAALKSQITSRQLPAGSRLPSSRMLCKEFNVGIPTVTRALNQLRDEGFIAILPKRAPVVLDYPRAQEESENGLALLSQHNLILQIYQIAVLFLPSALTFASSNYDMRFLPDYKQAMKMINRGTDRDSWRPVFSLCKELLSYGGNPLTADLFGALSANGHLTFFFDECVCFQETCKSASCFIAGSIMGALAESDPTRKTSQLKAAFEQLLEAVRSALRSYLAQYGSLPAQTADAFQWNPSHSHLYNRVTQDLMRKIGTGEYPPNTYLPSQAYLSTHYHVSASTTRAALACLSNMGLCQTLNGKGTLVQMPNPSATAAFLRLSAAKQDSMQYLHALQAIILLLYPAALYTAPGYTTSDMARLSEQLQKSDSVLLEDFVRLLIEHLDLIPLRIALIKTCSLADFSFHLAVCLNGRKQTVNYLNSKIESAYQSLSRQNYNDYANQLTDCFRYLLETVRQYMTEKGQLPEAQSVRTPFFTDSFSQNQTSGLLLLH